MSELGGRGEGFSVGKVERPGVSSHLHLMETKRFNTYLSHVGRYLQHDDLFKL